jgi:uncharacterized HAD superfamily protein
MAQLTIAIDIDDVLSASAEGFASFSNERWGSIAQAEDYVEAWAEFWDVSIEEALRRSDEFHASDTVARYGSIDNALPILEALHTTYRLVVVTSRQVVLKQHTDAWLDMHFPGLFSDIRYAGIWDSGHDVHHKLRQTKTEVCREIGAEFLIDDQLKHCESAAAAGMQALLFGNYKWNTAGILPTGVIRVKDWAAVGRYFDV